MSEIKRVETIDFDNTTELERYKLKVIGLVFNIDGIGFCSYQPKFPMRGCLDNWRMMDDSGHTHIIKDEDMKHTPVTQDETDAYWYKIRFIKEYPCDKCVNS